jgi:TetR/AcrR family transcriptional repressor of nem operon
MRRLVAQEIMNTVNFISDRLKKGIAAGEFKEDSKPGDLAYALFCAIEGALMVARIERSREPMDIIVDHCKKQLDQIST